MRKQWLLMMLTMAALATTAQAQDGAPAELRETLKSIVPDMQPDSVRKSAMTGLYEVSYGPEVIYISADGKYLLQGDLIDVGTRENLTEVRRAVGRKQVIDDIKKSSMIVFAPAEPKYTITVFTDVDCTYCRKLHGEMADYNREGIAVRYLAFPRAGVNSKSYHKIVNVWCAKDQRAAMTRAKRGEALEKGTCDHPVRDHLKAAERLRVSGTPTLVLDDGTEFAGYVPAKQLRQALDQMHAAAR